MPWALPPQTPHEGTWPTGLTSSCPAAPCSQLPTRHPSPGIPLATACLDALGQRKDQALRAEQANTIRADAGCPDPLFFGKQYAALKDCFSGSLAAGGWPVQST
ncbi:hypothetical protein D623_10006102 [Myotis brandtii]|uniref:Uncharacterized protein n=1 Tax=Myotis brandtii TaxID=109478 RepID=S7MLJ3_MYOBR|nr:hypothetical protein D623_10006102 [Myotis brandtii]